MPPERSAHKCVHPHALDAEWGMQQAVPPSHTHTHTCSWRASLLPHHSTKKEREREKGQPCASRTISTQMCALNAEWGMQQGVAHTHTHTHTCSWRAALLPHHSMKKGRGVNTHRRGCLCDGAGAGHCRHAWRGGHGQLHSCSAWIPPVP